MRLPGRPRIQKVRIVVANPPADSKPTYREFDPDDPLQQYEWSNEFDLTNPVGRRKVRHIAKLSKKSDHRFILMFHGEVVAELDHFPTWHEVEQVIAVHHGGGVYSVHSSDDPDVLLKSYSIEMAPVPPTLPTHEETHIPKLTVRETLENLQLQAINEILESPNSEQRDKIQLKLMHDFLGIEQPKTRPKSYEAELLEEAMEENPELKKDWAERLINQKLYGDDAAGKDANRDPMETFMAGGEEFVKLAKEIGLAGGKDSSGWIEGFKAFVAAGGIGQLVDGLRKMATPKEATGTDQIYGSVEPGYPGSPLPPQSDPPSLLPEPNDTPPDTFSDEDESTPDVIPESSVQSSETNYPDDDQSEEFDLMVGDGFEGPQDKPLI